jgi:hypothetical protein
LLKKIVFVAAAIATFQACESIAPLTEYRPVVDYERSNPAEFESDLVACRNIALQVEADYL